MKNNLYDVLGVDKNASEEEIKAAYRKKAGEHHPDKPGGSNEMMQLIVHANDVLKNKAKRDRYDKTGQDTDTPFDKQMESFLNEIMTNLLNDDKNSEEAFDQNDLMKHFRNVVQKNIDHTAGIKKKLESKIRKIKKVLNKTKSTKKENVFKSILDNHLYNEELQLNLNEESIQFFQRVMVILGDYRYEFTPPPPIEPVYFGVDHAEDIDTSIENYWNRRRKKQQ